MRPKTSHGLSPDLSSILEGLVPFGLLWIEPRSRGILNLAASLVINYLLWFLKMLFAGLVFAFQLST
jgi:hypothetical protein